MLVTSRPCAVSAQITAMSIAMIAIAEPAANGSQAKAAAALMMAMITPTVRPHTAPRKTANPAKKTMIPPIRWIHPHASLESLKHVVLG